ncbi:membrane-targeted effector domain-containing toxin [Pseudomonas sp. CFBP 13602]|uniref:membrane-targeted effector domain-containing toxin n=1 Tax=Pseudomonas sp. CFBP 13602 TaxID=2774039 RepID=UPI0031408472
MTDVLPNTQLGDVLAGIARQVTQQVPDLHQMAVATATQLLASMAIDTHPDAFYWHRFDNAQSSHRSFSGYAHMGPPSETMTFTELVMRRFRASDQDNADLLHVMGGFYTGDARAGWFDERNEVRLAPDKVLNALWHIDFAAAYRQALATFWTDNGPGVQTLIRINCLRAAVDAAQAGAMMRQQVQCVFDGLGCEYAMAPTLADLTGSHPPSHGVTVSTLQIAGHGFASVLCFKASGGECLLYLAGRDKAFEVFADVKAAQAWLHQQLQDVQRRERLLDHGRLLEPAAALARARSLALLAKKPLALFAAKVSWPSIAADAAHWLQGQTREQMLAEANLQLHSNSELRQQLWIGYLGAGVHLFGAAAMVSWPIALIVVVASAGKFALNVERAVNAGAATDRRAALYASIFSGIELLLNMILLISQRAPQSAELQPLQSRPQVSALTPLLPSAEGLLAVEGEQMIRLHGDLYRVRYDPSLRYWLIVDPQRPYAFTGNYPVRFNDQLQWELMPTGCLRGGGGCLSVSRQMELEPPPVSYVQFEVSATRYEVPLVARAATGELLSDQFRKMLSGEYFDPYTPLNPVLDSLNKLRVQLIEDANAFIAEWRSPGRSPLPVPDASLPPYTAVRRLLDESGALVIGESHQAIASKRFLIENMRALAGDGVDTLYMEHLMTDLHQADLNQVASDGRLPSGLQDYLRDQDLGHRTDPARQYNFTTLVQAARREGIQVRALDCAASYRLDGMDDLYGAGQTLRQRVFSYHASRVIAARTALPGRGKWIALVGDTHASTYKGVPGLAQLHDVTALRIVDAGAGQQTNITLDPGEYYLPSMGRGDGVVKADWRLALTVREAPFTYLDPSLAPPGVIRP